MRRINHKVLLNKNTHMRNTRLTIPALSPEKQIALLSLRARISLPDTSRIVLGLRRARNLLVQRLVQRILRQTRAVKSATSRSVIVTPAPDVGETFFLLCGFDDGASVSVATATTSAAAGAAFVGDIAGAASFDVVIGHVAVIGGFVPKAVALDVGAGGLADNFDVFAPFVAFHDGVVCSWAGAAVDGVPCDGVGADRG